MADATSDAAADAVYDWLDEVMAHCQALLWHHTLPTQITMDIDDHVESYLDQRWRAEQSISRVRQITGQDQETNLYAYFCADKKYQVEKFSKVIFYLCILYSVILIRFYLNRAQ